MRKFLLLAVGTLLPFLSASAALSEGDPIIIKTHDNNTEISWHYRVTSSSEMTVSLGYIIADHADSNDTSELVYSPTLIIPSAITKDNETYKVTALTIDYQYSHMGNILIGNWSSISIPSSVNEISSYAFNGSSNLKSVELNEGLKIIGDYAFSNTGLTEINLPESLEYCGNNAFSFTKISSIVFGENVKHVGDIANYAADKFDCITFPGGIEYIGTTDSDNIGTIIFYINDLEEWCSTEIEGYDKFHKNLYSDDTYRFEPRKIEMKYRGTPITELTIPMGVSSIKPYAFAGVESIKKVTFPTGLETIGEAAFVNTNINGISLPESVENIGDYSFTGCENIDGLVLPAGLKTLGAHAFENCSAIPEVNIPAGVEKIGDYAFSGCSDLSGVTLNEGLKEIGAYAFNKCEHFKTIDFPSTLEAIGDYAFYQTAISDLTCPAALTTIGDFAFARLYNIGFFGVYGNNFSLALDMLYEEHKVPSGCKILFNEGLENIGYKAFYLWGVQQVRLPSTLKSIGGDAFAYSKITTITLPESLTTIGDSAFDACHLLRSVTLGDAVTEIGVTHSAPPTCLPLTSPPH